MRYDIKLTFDRITVDANLTEASAPILVVSYDEDEGEETLSSTGLQTADVRHDVDVMALEVVKSFGPDYWLSPDAGLDIEDSEAVDAYVRGLIVSVA